MKSQAGGVDEVSGRHFRPAYRCDNILQIFSGLFLRDIMFKSIIETQWRCNSWQTYPWGTTFLTSGCEIYLRN